MKVTAKNDKLDKVVWKYKLLHIYFLTIAGFFFSLSILILDILFTTKCTYTHIHPRAFIEYLFNYVLYILGKRYIHNIGVGEFCINTI